MQCAVVFLLFSTFFFFRVGEAVTGVACQDGWISDGSSGAYRCYKAFGSNHSGVYTPPKSWYDAELDCQSSANGNGHLVSILNLFEVNFLNSMIRNNYSELLNHQFWIGAHDYRLNYTYEWTDGSPFTLNNYWAPGQPQDVNNQHCAESTIGSSNPRWQVLQCHYTNAYVCKSTPVNITCPPGPGWQPAGNACYNVYQTATDWPGAEQFCQTINLPGAPNIKGHLVSIHSQNENDVVLQLISTIGATSPTVCDSNIGYYWIGLLVNNTGAGTYPPPNGGLEPFWSDGTMWGDYINLMTPEYPPIAMNDQYCGQMGDNTCHVTDAPSTPLYYIQGQWYHNLCNATLPFVCKLQVPSN